MKKLSLSLLFFACFFYSNATNNLNSKFDLHKKQFVEQLWKIYPDWATTIGYHKYDSVLFIPNANQRIKEIKFLDKEAATLKTFAFDSLSDLNKIDYRLIENFVNETKWRINTLKSYEWNPTEYNVGETFAYMLSENYAPLKKESIIFMQR